MIQSFGYKHGPIVRAHKTFDVRTLTHDTNSPEFAAKRAEIQDYVTSHPGETVAIGCEKGLHRSRVLANQVATAARTSVLHRERK